MKIKIIKNTKEFDYTIPDLIAGYARADGLLDYDSFSIIKENEDPEILKIWRFLTKLRTALEHNTDEIYTELSKIAGKKFPIQGIK